MSSPLGVSLGWRGEWQDTRGHELLALRGSPVLCSCPVFPGAGCLLGKEFQKI